MDCNSCKTLPKVGDCDLMGGIMATIYEVAEKAGVSAATVSRVINGRAGINQATRLRVEQALEEEKFRPRWKAPAGNAVGLVVFPHAGCLSHPYNAHLVSAACETLFEAGFFVQLIPCAGGKRALDGIKRLLVTHQIQGVLVLALHPTYDVAHGLDCSSVPHVTLGAMPSASPLYQVKGDDFGGGQLAARYLWGLGHRSFALVTPPLHNYGHRQRLEGFQNALEELGADPRIVRSRECLDADSQTGASVVAELMLGKASPSAIVATNSSLALGIARGCRSMGMKIPADVSVLGFEDADELAQGEPAISAIRQPTRAIGERAARLLLAQIAGENTDDAHGIANESLEFSLAVRETTSAPKISFTPGSKQIESVV